MRRDDGAPRRHAAAALLASTALTVCAGALRGRTAWAHGFDTDRSISAVFQALPVAGFTVFGAAAAENAALVSAGGELRLANGFSLLAKFDGEFADGTQVYAGRGTLRYTW